MAKKTRKVLKQASQQRAIQQAAANVNMALTAAAQPAVGDPFTAAGRTVKANESRVEDYRYVKSDLRRISILAASFTAILVALSFVIR